MGGGVCGGYFWGFGAKIGMIFAKRMVGGLYWRGGLSFGKG